MLIEKETQVWLHLSFIYIYHFYISSLAVIAYKNLDCNFPRHESSIAQQLEHSGTSCVKFIFWVIRLDNASSLISLYPSHHFTYYVLTSKFCSWAKWKCKFGGQVKLASVVSLVIKVWTLCTYLAKIIIILIGATENWKILAHWATGFQMFLSCPDRNDLKRRPMWLLPRVIARSNTLNQNN